MTRSLYGRFASRFSSSFRCCRQRDSAGRADRFRRQSRTGGGQGARAAHQRRHRDAERLSLLLRRLRHADPHIDGKIVNIEGDPRSPHNEGTLCPKGAAIFQLHVNPNRPIEVLHRAPGAADWEVWDIERAMNRIAELTKKTRDETFIEKLPNGKLVNMTPAIFALGGATLEIEFNHIWPETHARSGHRRHRESGADMTQL